MRNEDGFEAGAESSLNSQVKYCIWSCVSTFVINIYLMSCYVMDDVFYYFLHYPVIINLYFFFLNSNGRLHVEDLSHTRVKRSS